MAAKSPVCKIARSLIAILRPTPNILVGWFRGMAFHDKGGQIVKLKKCCLLYIMPYISVCMFLLFSISSVGFAEESTFRKEFISNYMRNLFNQQAELVKKNKDIIPGEVRLLVADAMFPGTPYERKMHLLNIANAMASMYKHWHNDEKPLSEVETILRMEVQKEKERVAELTKWDKYGKFLGNIVIKDHLVRLETKNLTPVIFPHWLHRIWFQCKVCHQDIFIMKKGANDISYDLIMEGKQCGVCHNGKIAFDARENCDTCHNAGKPDAEKLYDIAMADHKKIKEVAERLGAEWHPEKLHGGKIPIDRFGFIDWLALKENKAFNPVGSLTKDFQDIVRDNRILFETVSPTVNNVIFDHKIHSSWIQCSTCHPDIFENELGGNRITMADIARGRFCGHCHGKVSFTFADCLRCHKQPKGVPVKGALIHKQKQ